MKPEDHALPPDLLGLLRCPQTGQRLSVAPAELVESLESGRRAGTLRCEAAQPQFDPALAITGGLLREDGLVCYAVQDGIPVLLPDHGIRLSNAEGGERRVD